MVRLINIIMISNLGQIIKVKLVCKSRTSKNKWRDEIITVFRQISLTYFSRKLSVNQGNKHKMIFFSQN